MTQTPEDRVALASHAVQDAQAVLRAQVRDAYAKGLSLRKIAAAAGVSHEQVRRMIFADQT